MDYNKYSLEIFLNGGNLLHAAASRNDLNLCQKLLQTESNVNEKNFLGLSPLMLACKNSNINIVNLLLSDPSIKINQEDLYGQTAIFYVIRTGSIQIFDKFIQNSLYWTLDWNHEDHFKETALLTALKYGTKEIILKLLEVDGINWNIEDSEGNNGPMIAVIKNQQDTFRIFLSKLDIDFEKTNNKKECLLMLGTYSNINQFKTILYSIRFANI